MGSDYVFASSPPHPLDPPPTEGVGDCILSPAEGVGGLYTVSHGEGSDFVLSPTERADRPVLIYFLGRFRVPEKFSKKAIKFI